MVKELLRELYGKRNIAAATICEIPVLYSTYLWNIAKLLYRFHDSYRTLSVPKIENAFEKMLYSTCLSYLPTDTFSYPLKMNRYAQVQLPKSSRPQIFLVNITKPGIAKSNHWHHTKYDKFLAISGNGLI